MLHDFMNIQELEHNLLYRKKINYRAALCNRTFCNDGNILYLHTNEVVTGRPRVATDYLKSD